MGDGDGDDDGSNSKQLHLRIFRRWVLWRHAKLYAFELTVGGNQSRPGLMLQQQRQPSPSRPFACLPS